MCSFFVNLKRKRTSNVHYRSKRV